ncbi:hypothetical protein MNBD_GAMMA15-1615 [hydrothermal vent metagenome]|uniref:DUF2970 domain-containing protein n=1 Tax=hydrothermal vent metagenome TaxID=652676 RepID=A0A3B0Y6T1_9ZZZZ
MSDQEKSPSPQGQSLFSVIGSVAASMFGVQSGKKHDEDFKHGKASTYIIIGAIATLVFVLTVWGVVQLVVSIVQPT